MTESYYCKTMDHQARIFSTSSGLTLDAVRSLGVALPGPISGWESPVCCSGNRPAMLLKSAVNMAGGSTTRSATLGGPLQKSLFNCWDPAMKCGAELACRVVPSKHAALKVAVAVWAGGRPVP